METLAPYQGRCDGCETPLVSPLFCFSCESLRTPKAKPNYFEVFGLSYSYDLSLEKLEEQYEGLATELHPDFYAASPIEIQRQSEESAALLNLAYGGLKNPSKRAFYLLELLAKDASLNERELPKGFLQEMFFLQESLDELLEEGGNSDELEETEKELKSRLLKVEEHYPRLFNELETTTDRSGVLQKIQTEVNAERYIFRLLERCQSGA